MALSGVAVYQLQGPKAKQKGGSLTHDMAEVGEHEKHLCSQPLLLQLWSGKSPAVFFFCATARMYARMFGHFVCGLPG